MATVAGIISEYNPLHRGHAYLFDTLRCRGADTIVCAMSGNFVQRGDAALTDKHSRAEMAVCCGADLVVELPTPWAMATAETFAAGGVQLLRLTGCTTVAFGSECGDGALLRRVAAALTGDDVQQELKRRLESGITYAAARQQAAETVLGTDAACLRQPNDTLGVEYCKAVARLGADMDITAIRRTGAPHDGAAEDGIASASHLRQLVLSGQLDAAAALMPPAAAEILRREAACGRVARIDNAARSILTVLRCAPEESLRRYDGGGEGLYHRLYDAIHSAATPEEILALTKTKRYTASRLRRMMLAAWLGLEAPASDLPYVRVLAANERGRAHLRTLHGGAPLLTKPADVGALGAAAETLFRAEAQRTDLYTLCYDRLCESVPGSDWRKSPVMK